MQTLAYQNSNILENFYTDGVMTYITTPTINNIPYQFNSIISYCNTYIPKWKPNYNDPRNRLAYNHEIMFEIIFYKNLILAIPLYIYNQSKFDIAITNIKSYSEKLTRTEDKFDSSLAALLDYKFIFYSPNTITGQTNIFKTKHTIINTELYSEMYQSKPMSLKDNTMDNFMNIDINHIYQNINPNYSVSNPLYVPYQNFSQHNQAQYNLAHATSITGNNLSSNTSSNTSMLIN